MLGPSGSMIQMFLTSVCISAHTITQCVPSIDVLTTQTFRMPTFAGLLMKTVKGTYDIGDSNRNLSVSGPRKIVTSPIISDDSIQ